MDANKTLAYYDINAKSFIEGTVNVDFTYVQNKFLDNIGDVSVIRGCK